MDIPDVIKADLSAKLENLVKNYSSYVPEISSSDGTPVHSVALSGAGMLNGRTDTAALDKMLRKWVNNVRTASGSIKMKSQGGLAK